MIQKADTEETQKKMETWKSAGQLLSQIRDRVNESEMNDLIKGRVFGKLDQFEKQIPLESSNKDDDNPSKDLTS